VSIHPVSLRPETTRILAAAGFLVALLLAAQTFPAVVRQVFCLPSAWLSGQFLGVPMLPAADGFQLDCPTLPVDVTLACSGTTFFAMLFALLLVTSTGLSFRVAGFGPTSGSGWRDELSMRNQRPTPKFRLFFVGRWLLGVGRWALNWVSQTRVVPYSLVLAYLITLAANTARIVLGWHAALWANARLPLPFHSGVHLAVGIIVFSGFLLAGVFVTQRIKS
jgi:hypothetical protein